jgi:cytochrome c-type biogenesis protein CcmH
MIFWALLALMTVVAIAAVLWPLSRPSVVRGGSDIAVYRDQLDEIERDRAAGLIGATEAEAAKVEVSRRLLAAADAETAETKVSDGAAPWRQRGTAIAGLALLPIGAVALYLTLGSPDMPGMPLAERQSAQSDSDRSIEAMVAKVEVHVEQNPNDGRAWEVLAPVYMRIGRYDDAVRAWGNAIRLNGSTASREADYGEALVAAANGVVTVDAKAAFERALALDKADVMARFYLGMAADQDGRRAEADAIWNDLLANAPAGAPWVEIVRHAMARQAPGGQTAEASAAPPHGDSDVNSMVERLADRLKQNGSDHEGWLRLIRSYRVLGQNDKAETAIANARQALASDPDKLRDFNGRVDKETNPALPPAPSTAVSALPGAGQQAPAAPEAPFAGQAPVAAAPSAPGPTAEQMNAAANMGANDRNEMIRGMVARLADRLKENGNDIDGWERLLRAYVVLGDKDKAKAAAADARKAFAGDADKLRQINDTIKSLGIEG